MPAPKILYAETYRAWAAKVKAHLLPTLPHAAGGWVVAAAYVLKVGRVQIDEDVYEFHDVRVLLKPESQATVETAAERT